MATIITFQNINESPTMFIDGEKYDTHFKAYSHKEYLEKCTFMAFKKYGWYAKCYIASNEEEVLAVFTTKYLTINGEYAWDYVSCLPASIPENDWNGCFARTLAYNDYKKLLEAGFTNHFSATTAYNHQLLKVNPDWREIFGILGIKEVED